MRSGNSEIGENIMAAPKKILFWPDVYKEEGHWLPTFAWADYLYSQCEIIDDEKVHKYEVEYMGICDCRKIISDYVTINPISENHCIYHYNNILSKTYPKLTMVRL